MGEVYREPFALAMAYQTLSRAEVFANHCGDGVALTNEAVALYLITHTEHDDRVERLVRAAEFGTTEAKLYALVALRTIDMTAFERVASRLERTGTFGACGGCILSDDPVQPEYEAIARGERQSMITELESDSVVGGYYP